MPVDWQTVEVPLSVGLDTKTDPKVVNGQRMREIENGVFQTTGSTRKRNGADVLAATVQGTGTLNEGYGLAKNGVELLMRGSVDEADGDLLSRSLLTRSGAIDKWVPTQEHISIGNIDTERLLRPQSDHEFVDMFVLGDMTIVAERRTGKNIRIATIDAITGSIIDSLAVSSFFAVGETKVQCIGFAGRLLAVFTASDIAETISIVGVFSASITDGILIGSAGGNITDPDLLRQTVWDISLSTNGLNGIFVYADFDTGENRFRTFDNFGNLSAATSFSGTARRTLTCFPYSTDKTIILYQDLGSNDLVFRILTESTSTVGGTNTVQAISGVALVSRATGVFTGTYDGVDNAAFFWEMQVPSSTPHLAEVRVSDEANLPTVFRFGGVALKSKAFVYKEQGFVWLAQESDGDENVQPTYFLGSLSYDAINFTTNRGALTSNASSGENREPVNIHSRLFALRGGGQHLRLNFLETVTRVGGQRFTMAMRVVEEGRNIAGSIVFSSRRVDFDMEATALPFAEQAGQTFLSGGQINHYDGRLKEDGFHLFPHDLALDSAPSTGGSLVDGTYLFVATYEWTDRDGNIHRSSPSLPLKVTLAGGTSTQRAVIRVPTLGLGHPSRLGEVNIVLYRTLVGALILHKTDSNGEVPNDYQTDLEITLEDLSDDDALDDRAIIYTTGGVLRNIAPPASRIVVTDNLRVYVISEDDRENIFFSKEKDLAVAVEFSDFLTKRITEGGDITAMAVMDGSKIVFKRDRIFAFAGEGPNDLGQGVFSASRLVDGTVGAVNQRSVILTPGGLIFKSDRGFYLLGRNFQTQYIGQEVEAENTASVIAAVLDEALHHVIFHLSGGVSPTIVYNYLQNKWARFDHVVADALSVDRRHIRLASDATVLRENPAVFRDGTVSYPLRLQTNWINLAGIQGFQRIRRFSILGEKKSDHILRVKVYYDNSDVALEEFEFRADQTLLSPDKEYHFRARLGRQKCRTIRFDLEDIALAGTFEGYSATTLGLEVGVKSGITRRKRIKTVKGRGL